MSKYDTVCPDTVKRLAEVCAKKYPKAKDAEKALKTALHGITGAFMTPKEAKAAFDALEAWKADPTDANLEQVLIRHASTRERLPLFETDALYERIFAACGRPKHILDLACGINPVYLAARGFAVRGVDISGAAVELDNAVGEAVNATCADLLCEGALPVERYDLALMFKLLPVLETDRKGTGAALLSQVNARSIAVSFPTRTLGGRNVGMEAHYSAWIEANLPDKLRVADRFIHGTELVYCLINKE